MSIRKQTNASKYIEKIRGRPLSFGDMLQSIRQTEEISQVELANIVGISRAKMCDFEKGRRKVSIELASKFALALGFPIPVFVEQVITDQIREANLNIKVKVEAA